MSEYLKRAIYESRLFRPRKSDYVFEAISSMEIHGKAVDALTVWKNDKRIMAKYTRDEGVGRILRMAKCMDNTDEKKEKSSQIRKVFWKAEEPNLESVCASCPFNYKNIQMLTNRSVVCTMARGLVVDDNHPEQGSM